MEFPDFLGNSEVKAAVSAAFRADRFPHAICIWGDGGCGKRTFAKLIANGLVCRDKAHAPCGTCPSCIRARAGSHPDIRVIEGTGATKSLSVETVKEVISDAYRMPEEADVSVYILLFGSRTSEAAQNKLLKVIEEPPEGAVFLLVCSSPEQLLPTIRSRVQSFQLRPPAFEDAVRFGEEKMELSREEAERLATLCGCNIGRMQEEKEGGEAAAAAQIAAAMAAGMTSARGDALLKAVMPLHKDRKLCSEVLARLGLIFRDAVVLRTTGMKNKGVTLLGGAPKESEALCSLPLNRLCELPRVVEEFTAKTERNANMTLLLAALCSKLRQTAGR